MTPARRPPFLPLPSVLLLAGCVALASSCVTVRTTGVSAAPRFSGVAPGPVVTLEPLACLDTGVPGHAFPEQKQLETELRERLPGPPLPLEATEVPTACQALATTDAAFVSDLVHGTNWEAAAALAPRLAEVAKRSGAASVYVPVVRVHVPCAPTDPFFDAPPLAPGRYGAAPSSCQDGPRIDAGVFLFDARGQLLWKSTGSGGSTDLALLRPMVERVANAAAPEGLPDRATVIAPIP